MKRATLKGANAFLDIPAPSETTEQSRPSPPPSQATDRVAVTIRMDKRLHTALRKVQEEGRTIQGYIERLLRRHLDL